MNPRTREALKLMVVATGAWMEQMGYVLPDGVHGAVKQGRRQMSRTEMERGLEKELAKLNQAHMARILEELGDPPSLANVSAAFWEKSGGELLRALTRFSTMIYLERAREAMEDYQIGVDWALVNKGALEWAADYSFQLVKGITETTRTLINTGLERFFQGDFTRGDLNKFLEPAFGPVRAEMISITEVTRASNMGEEALRKEIVAENPNIEMIPIWLTREDELVCPICGSLADQEAEFDGARWYWTDAAGDKYYSDEAPPAHPRCRCDHRHDVRLRNG